MSEPVAWQVKDYGDGWITVSSASSARELSGYMSGATIRPLYAEPVPQPAQDPAGAVTREELVEIMRANVRVEATGMPHIASVFMTGFNTAADAIIARLGETK